MIRAAQCILFLVCMPLVPLGANEEADKVVVVYNTDFEGSESLARYYAAKRKIPSRQLIGLSCPPAEAISREEYDEKIAGPFQRLMVRRGWWKTTSSGGKIKVRESDIRYVVLMRGMPLKIKRTTLGLWKGKAPQPPQVWKENAASVDSELAALGTAEHDLLRGAMPNPYFQAATHLNSELYPELLLVTRLDGPTHDDVKRMIDDSLDAEANGLDGYAFIDARGIQKKGLKVGDDWLFRASELLVQWGMPVVVDRHEGLFARDYPFRDVAIYLGWYSGRAVPPFGRDEFRFATGGIAAHIHSFSASTVRNPRDHWVGPFIKSGACATLGNVYEPYLGLTVNLDTFIERLKNGSNFAEAGYAAQPALSWMNVLVGDPLYRPFLEQNKFVPIDESVWAQVRQATRAWQANQKHDVAVTLERAKTSEDRGILAESLALTALARRNFDDAFDYLEKAREAFEESSDWLRIILHEVEAHRLRGDVAKAKELLKSTMRSLPDPTSDEALLLREIEFQIAPPKAEVVSESD